MLGMQESEVDTQLFLEIVRVCVSPLQNANGGDICYMPVTVTGKARRMVKKNFGGCRSTFFE